MVMPAGSDGESVRACTGIWMVAGIPEPRAGLSDTVAIRGPSACLCSFAISVFDFSQLREMAPETNATSSAAARAAADQTRGEDFSFLGSCTIALAFGSA